MTPHILVVDDEKAILKLLTDMLKDEGFLVSSAENGYEALKQIEKEEPDLVLLDIYLPGINGIETLQEIKKINASIPVIIISSYGNIDNAVHATKLGAYDFIEKPLSIDKTLVAIKNALQYQKLEEENRFLKSKNLEKNAFTGSSDILNELKGKLFQAGLSDDNVLLQGENGTGKKLAARNIHFLSSRSEFPMITINCNCLSAETAEKNLFGCAKGYLGEDSPKIKGHLELSDNSTLFLDEVNKLSPEIQSKLLEFIETKKLSRLGESREIKINARIIAATSQDIDSLMEESRMEKSLFYRLNVINIKIPALRERENDIDPLIDHFLNEASKTYGVHSKKLSRETRDILKNHHWPGNVRELKNLMNSLTLLNNVEEISPQNLPKDFSYLINSPEHGDLKTIMDEESYESALEKFQKNFVIKKLMELNGDIEKTAMVTGIDKEIIKKITG